MAEKNIFADAIGAYLWQTPEFGFKESEILVIHTDTAGEITKRDLEKARRGSTRYRPAGEQDQGDRQCHDAA